MTQQSDELGKARFSVTIDDVSVAGWKTIQLPRRYSEEPDDSDRYQQAWGQTEYDDLEMERGVKPGDTKLWDWRSAVEAGKVDEGRKTVTVSLLDDQGTAQMTWEFTDAWPKDYEPPDLDASADSGEVATEKVTIVYNEMLRRK